MSRYKICINNLDLNYVHFKPLHSHDLDYKQGNYNTEDNDEL